MKVSVESMIMAAKAAKELERMRKYLEENGPTPLEIAQQRIAELEKQRDEIYRDIAEWLESFQPYFPGAVTLHDIYKGIEALESKIAALEARNKWINERVYSAEWRDKDGRITHYQPEGEGFFDQLTQKENWVFTEAIDYAIGAGK